MSHYLNGKKQLLLFFAHYWFASLSKQPFPMHIDLLRNANDLQETLFSTNLMKNSQLLNFQLSQSVWTIRQKRTFEICERFRLKKTYLIINLVAIIMMFFIRPSQDFNPSKNSFLPQPQDDQSQKNFNRVAFLYQKNREISKIIFLDYCRLETFR